MTDQECHKAIAMLLALPKRADQQFSVESFCFKEQIDFINDKRPFKTAVCSRRSGKTIACAVDLINTALRNSKRVCLYITLSRNNAKKIIWGEILEINRRFNLNAIANETELSLTFPNASIIYLSGAKDKSEIEKFRGLPLTLCYLDESQSFRPHIQSLVDDIISKALFDYDGTLCLIGTPGPVPSGYFYDCAHSLEWSHHSWTMFQNPWLQKKSGKTPQELVDRELKRKGITIEDPTIQRECFGKWCVDIDAIVFKYDRIKNDYTSIPDLVGKWEYVIGVDVGFDDADAIAVLGWNEHIKKVYLFEEHVQAKQGITDLAIRIEALIKKYDPLKIVMDTGGLGKKIAEEIQMRYSLPIEAAEKSRKFEFIELLNDAMRTSRFFAKKDSRFAQDCLLVEWDKDSVNPKVSDNYHSDITDAVLYAFRESLHWLAEALPVKPKAGRPEWMIEQEREMEEAAENAQKILKEDDIWHEESLNY